jgi:hypothetical protein
MLLKARLELLLGDTIGVDSAGHLRKNHRPDNSRCYPTRNRGDQALPYSGQLHLLRAGVEGRSANEPTVVRARMDSSPDRLNAITQRLVCTAIVLCLLYVGKDILMPTVVAVVLGFALMPLVRRLQHLGLNRTLSVAVVVSFTCLLLGNVVLNMGAQLVRIAESLPQYEYNIRDKLTAIDDLTLGKLKRHRRSLAKCSAALPISPRMPVWL